MEPYALDVDGFRPGKIVEIKHPFVGHCSLFMIKGLCLTEEAECKHTLDKTQRDTVEYRRTTFDLELEGQYDKEIEPDWSIATSDGSTKIQIGEHWYFFHNWQIDTTGRAQLTLTYALGGSDAN